MSGASKHSADCTCHRCQGFQPGNEIGRQFEPGNQLRTTHGASSEIQLRPVRAELDQQFAVIYPDLSPERRAILADRCARLVLARRFLDRKGIIADEDTGGGWPILKNVSAWERDVDRTLSELEARRTDRQRAGNLERLIEAGRATRGGTA